MPELANVPSSVMVSVGFASKVQSALLGSVDQKAARSVVRIGREPSSIHWFSSFVATITDSVPYGSSGRSEKGCAAVLAMLAAAAAPTATSS